MKLDILAFGVHPDDIELGCAGTIMVAIAEGKKVGVIDLTKGELGTRGNAEQRIIEANNAAKLLGLSVRENLGMADAFFQNDETNLKAVIQAIRKYQPEIILCNAPEDRHPDHGRSSKLVADATFLAGLRKIETLDENGQAQTEWRPNKLYHYVQDKYIEPSFVVDISNYFDKKIEAMLCFTTQFFNPAIDEPATYISSAHFLEITKARAIMMGKKIGVTYGEGFIAKDTVGVKSVFSFI